MESEAGWLSKLWKARSLLYRSRFLQPNTNFEAFFEIYKIIIPSHRSQLNNLANFRWQVFAIFKKKSRFSAHFIEVCTDFDEKFPKFRQIPLNVLRVPQISGFLMDSDRLRAEF